MKNVIEFDKERDNKIQQGKLEENNLYIQRKIVYKLIAEILHLNNHNVSLETQIIGNDYLKQSNIYEYKTYFKIDGKNIDLEKVMLTHKEQFKSEQNCNSIILNNHMQLSEVLNLINRLSSDFLELTYLNDIFNHNNVYFNFVEISNINIKKIAGLIVNYQINQKKDNQDYLKLISKIHSYLNLEPYELNLDIDKGKVLSLDFNKRN